MLINVKMPTVVGILTFIGRINTVSEFLSRNDYFFYYCSFYKQLKCHSKLR